MLQNKIELIFATICVANKNKLIFCHSFFLTVIIILLKKIIAFMLKTIKHLFTILVATICLASCSSADEDVPDTNTDPLVKQMKFDGASIDLPINPGDVNFNFEYDSSNRLTKKIGGYLPLPPETFFDAFFTDKAYTSLVYSTNKVTVENFYDSDIYAVAKGTIYYTLNSANLIAEKEVPNTIAINTKKQVYKYAEGKLTEVVTSYPNMTYYPEDPTDYILTFSEKFFYDANNNLTKTEYTELHNGKSEGEKIVRIFEDYDTSYNPFKRMQLLEEYFYRSLSRNNFRKYTQTSYYYDSVSTKETDWTFVYDAQGNIIVN